MFLYMIFVIKFTVKFSKFIQTENKSRHRQLLPVLPVLTFLITRERLKVLKPAYYITMVESV